MQSENIWNKLNDAEWETLRRQMDWMSASGMHNHVTTLMGGEHWLEYARDTHLAPLLDAIRVNTPGKKGLKLLSIGSRSYAQTTSYLHTIRFL